MKINNILEVYSLIGLDGTAVNIADNLPEAGSDGESVQFQFDGTQDQAIYLSNAGKTIWWQLCEASTFTDAGPFDCDRLRGQGLTYIYAGGTVTAGNMPIARVEE